jgi:hypothetical protein
MSYGIVAYGTDNKIAFHSDYSSVVYAGQMSATTSSVQPTYTGDHHVAINGSTRISNYDMGRIIQYDITLDVDFFVPFYCPNHDGQEICIMDVINEGTKWVVNLLYSGADNEAPTVYAFAPLTELPSSAVTLNDNGIVVFDGNSDLVFTDSKRPLRVDDVITITHPSSIKTNSKGSVSLGANSYTTTQHVNFTSNQEATYSGTTTNTSNKLYSIVPSAYGGLAYLNNGSGTIVCADLIFFQVTKQYAFEYKSWASFRGCVRHPRNTTTHTATWKADFGGAAYQYVDTDCGIGGLLGAILGIIAVVFTGGAALAVIGGALAGFVIGEMTAGTTPSIKAYDQDEVFDQNSRPVNLMVTDKSYYGIT